MLDSAPNTGEMSPMHCEKIFALREKNPHWTRRHIAAQLGIPTADVDTCVESLYERPPMKLERIVRAKRHSFLQGTAYRTFTQIDWPSAFQWEELRDKLVAHPFCYITGASIDLLDRASYSLDHIIPVALGGDASLANCGPVTRAINRAKHHMPLDDFIELCRSVVRYQDRKTG
jgi:HNH endonuclease